MAATAPLEEAHRIVAAAFDASFYRAANPDVAERAEDPLAHYLAAGWREGRDPAPWFSVAAYLAANPDIAEADLEPLEHYIRIGRWEGRAAAASVHALPWARALERARDLPQEAGDALVLYPPEPVVEPEPEPEPMAAEPIAEVDPAIAAAAARLAIERALVAPELDADYYLGANPDVAAAGSDPVDHFLMFGWKEGRDPTPWFSVSDYLDAFPVVAEVGINPFVHWLEIGRAQGLAPRQQLGFRYDIIRKTKPLADRVADVVKASAKTRPFGLPRLAKALSKSRSGLADLHVTFSHDDFTANTGGVQLCLQREAAEIAALGRDHLHLFPTEPWPVVRTAAEPGRLGVVWNGKSVGPYAVETIREALAAAVDGVTPGARSFAIHSLLGHSADETAELLGVLGLTGGYFWLHDFGSLCAGFHLLRNDVQDCAAPPPESAACSICQYLPFRRRHLSEHERLFRRLDLTVVAPSQATLDLWKASWDFPAVGEVVLPHASLTGSRPAPTPTPDRPFRLAYAGAPAAHKGWPIFRELMLRFAGDPRYEFLHLAVRTEGGLPLAFHEVRVTDDRPTLMRDTLAALEVDAVLIWPLCRETFSFTAYEAVAAGCAVITNPDSGNVQAFVRAGSHGWVLDDEHALEAALVTGRITELARDRRGATLHRLAHSRMTVDLLEAGR